MGGISIWQLLIIAVIVLLLFGTKKLRNLGGDLGSAIKGFKKAMNEDETKSNTSPDSISDKTQKSEASSVKDSVKEKDQV